MPFNDFGILVDTTPEINECNCHDIFSVQRVRSTDEKKNTFLYFWIRCLSLGVFHNHNPSIYLFAVLRRFQHCTGHIMTGSWKGRGNQYIQFVRVLYCKLPTNGKQLPAFPLEALPGTEPWPQRWQVLPLCHRDPS